MTPLSLPDLSKKFIFLFGSTIFVLWFIQSVSMLYETKTTEGMLAARDSDAHAILIVAKRTSFIKDNNYRAYGPLYFKLAHGLAKAFRFNDASNETDYDNSHHFALMLTNLLPLIGLVFLICYLLSLEKYWWPLVATSVLSAIISVPLFSTFIFKAHPDYLLSLFVGVGTLFSVRYYYEKKASHFILSSIFWGAAAATKLSMVLFIPAFFFLFSPRDFKSYTKSLFWFAGIMLISYFLFGFPQNFKIGSSIAFLLDQGKLNKFMTIESVTNWIKHFYEIFLTPFLFIIALKILSNKIPKSRPIDLRICLFLLSPVLFLLSKRVLTMWQHYAFPFVFFITFTILIVLDRFTLKLPLKLKNILIFMFCIASLGTNGIITKTQRKERNEQLRCQKERDSAYNEIEEALSQNKKVFIDPGVPYNSRHKNVSNLRPDWGKTLPMLEKWKPSLVILGGYRTGWHHKSVSEYKRTEFENWREIKKFYMLFKKTKSTGLYKGLNYQLVRELGCSYQVWKLAPLSH